MSNYAYEFIIDWLYNWIDILIYNPKKMFIKMSIKSAFKIRFHETYRNLYQISNNTNYIMLL